MNFVLVYAALSSRTLKLIHGIDYNVSPQEDISAYGESAVQTGKINRKHLKTLKRNETAHANAVKNFPMFDISMLWAIDASALVYTVLRIAYGAVYL